MKRLIFVLLALSLTGCAGVVVESAVAPMPMAAPVEAPSISLPAPGVSEVVLPFTIPLPGLHDQVVPSDHAIERHGDNALRARRIIEDPNSDCQFFKCNGPSGPGTSVLRQCIDPTTGDYALQYIWADTAHGRWAEGTAFTQQRSNALRYRDSKGCTPTGKPFTYNDHPSMLLDWIKQEGV